MKTYNPDKDDLRWIDRETNSRVDYLETLKAMCEYYGIFSGRWHDNEFWRCTKIQIASMTEEQAKLKVFEIENEAEMSLEEWRQYQ